jgi:hypothetical protein
LCKGTEATLRSALHVYLLLLLFTLQNALRLFSQLVLSHLHDFLLALLCNGAGLLLHLHLDLALRGFLLGLEFLQGKQVYQLFVLLIHLHQLLGLTTIRVYSVRNLRVDTFVHVHV